jgi:hypothetical protein
MGTIIHAGRIDFNFINLVAGTAYSKTLAVIKKPTIEEV